MKIAVLHDFFEIRGGGERLVITLAKHLDADLIYGFWNENSYPLDGVRGRSLNEYTKLIGWRTVKEMRAFQKLKDLDQYDIVIYSGNDALFARANRTRSGNIFYCHTPPRYIYDKKAFFASRQNVFGKIFLKLLTQYVQPRYEAAVRSMDIVLTNSRSTQERIRRYLNKSEARSTKREGNSKFKDSNDQTGGIEAQVVYPPCDTKLFRWIEQSDYYLSTARLDDLKNVDRIVQAFQKLPDKKLIVISGGTREKEIRCLAEGFQNIQILWWVDDVKLRELIGRCIATIYVPTDEDFGMSPVESMAAGKPVIGVASGGMNETVLHKQTGILLRHDFSIENLREGVRWTTPERAVAMRGACERRAEEFSQESFLKNTKKIIESLAVTTNYESSEIT